MNEHYILDVSGNPVVESDPDKWIKWMGDNASRVRIGYWTRGMAAVSTVFLGSDSRFSGDGKPLLFETMVFGVKGWRGEHQGRYATKADASEGHGRIVRMVERFLDEQQTPNPTDDESEVEALKVRVERLEKAVKMLCNGVSDLAGIEVEFTPDAEKSANAGQS